MRRAQVIYTGAVGGELPPLFGGAVGGEERGETDTAGEEPGSGTVSVESNDHVPIQISLW